MIHLNGACNASAVANPSMGEFSAAEDRSYYRENAEPNQLAHDLQVAPGMTLLRWGSRLTDDQIVQASKADPHTAFHILRKLPTTRLDLLRPRLLDVGIRM